ncbi:glycosyltransferase family 4 protein [Bergeriella denitrificans]|uniref:Lipopolysaccharide 1,2-N-acetylglucosaminetransferase n=1 Tax=Bergeriella denitrificans TaxID=494 RepID=A0A378UFM3_BERDE|nr:glycosyltransferase family 4 protein [Bergeriella denitrificans]STZ76126.1 lipopolysaccharide 1,2-N-acetylglucosaminetransferase [Bergeriella denitrificans]
MKKVLFLSHELSATGAPKMLYYAALAVKNSGGFPTVFSPIDGVMRQKLTQADIPVVIDQRISLELVQNFEVVVVNTVIQPAVVRALVKVPNLTVVWWLHESQLLASILGDNKDLADSNVRIICVSEYAKSFMPAGFRAEVLLNGIPDDVSPTALNQSCGRKLTFSVLGTIEPNKGQDIFCAAIASLPPKVRQNCRFIMAGRLLKSNTAFWQAAYAPVQDFKEVQYVGALHPDEVSAVIGASDVIVCCSRDESFSLVCIEAAKYQRAVLLNDHVGVANIFMQEDSCLVFDVGNAQSLANAMCFAYENPEKVEMLGTKARNTFERYFSFEQFAKSFLAQLD